MATPAGLTVYTPGLNGFSSANFTGSGGSGAGSWASFSDTGCWNGSGGYSSNANGDQANLTVPNNTQAIYALLRVLNGNSGVTGGGSTVTRFKLLRDGVVQGDDKAVLIDSYRFNGLGQRYTFPLYRYGSFNWASGGPHTIALQNVFDGSSQTLQVDGFLVVTSKASADPTGGISCIGDSWTARGGSSHPLSAYAPKLASMLTRLKGREVPLTNLGVNGDMQFGQDSTKTGGMYRFVQNFLAAPTPYLSWLYGPNDLGNYHEGGFCNALLNVCCLMSDTIDHTIKPVIGTPGWRAPILFMPTQALVDIDTVNQPGPYYSGPLEATLGSVELVRMLPHLFPTLGLGIADVFDIMAYDTTLLSPNASRPRDAGNHLNDRGTERAAWEFTRAFVGTQGGVSWQ